MKRRNAVSESDTNIIKELQDLKNSVNKNNPIDNQKKTSDSEDISPSSINGKHRIKKPFIYKPVRLYNWNQPISTLKVTH